MKRVKKASNRSGAMSLPHGGAQVLIPRQAATRAVAIAALLVAAGCASFQSASSDPNAPGLRSADAALRGGAGQLALQVSDSVLRTAPSNTSAQEIKADALAMLGRNEEAAEIFQTLLSRNPDSVRANIGMGRIKLLTDAATAEPLFLRVLRRDPNNLTALNNLGITRDLLGRHGEAQATYRQALALSPDMESAVVNLSLSLAMSGQGDEAIRLIGPKARKPGASAKIQQDYATVLSMSGRPAEARSFLATAVSPDRVADVLDSVTPTHAQAISDLAPPQAETTRMASAADTPRAWSQAAPAAAPVPAPPVARASAPIVTSQVTSTPLPAVASPAAPRGFGMPSGLDKAAAAQPTNLAEIAALVTREETPEEAVRPAIIVPMVVPMPPPVRAAAVQAPMPVVHTPSVTLAEVPPAVSYPMMGRAAAALTMSETPSAPDSTVTPMPPVAATDPAPHAAVVTRMAAPAVAAAPVMPAPVVAAPPVPTPPVAAAAPARTVAEAPVHVETHTDAPPRAEAAARTTLALVTGDARHAPVNSAVSAHAPAGTAVQFSAATSEEAAHALWNTLVHKFPAELGHREAIVIRVEIGHNVFWRLRTAGFESAADARGLCSHLRAAGQACFVPNA